MYRRDTTEDVQKVYDQKIRELSETERFLRGLSLTEFSRKICLDEIRRSHPHLGKGQVMAKFFERTYGDLFPHSEKRKISDSLARI